MSRAENNFILLWHHIDNFFHKRNGIDLYTDAEKLEGIRENLDDYRKYRNEEFDDFDRRMKEINDT